MALRRNPPARNPREGVLQYIKKERKKVKASNFVTIESVLTLVSTSKNITDQQTLN